MLYESLDRLYRRVRLLHYRLLFGRIREKSGSLSATEAYSVDVINLLDRPTIKQFSDFLGISQPNATYKIASLVEKGYVEREQSPEDKREVRLVTGEKFRRYYDSGSAMLRAAVHKLESCYSRAEVELFGRMLDTLTESVE